MERIRVTVDVKQAVDDLRRRFWTMSDGEFNRRMAAVLNEVRRKSRTELAREVRQDFPGIKLQTIKAAQSDIPASASKLRVVLKTKGRPIPINKLKGRATKRGVTYNLTGSRELIARAFVRGIKFKKLDSASGQEIEGETQLPFARGKYVRKNNSGFMFMKGGRKPLDVIRSVSVPGAQLTKDVSAKYLATLSKTLEKRAEHVILNAFTRK